LTKSILNDNRAQVYLYDKIKSGNIGWGILAVFVALIILGLIFENPSATIDLCIILMILLVLISIIAIIINIKLKFIKTNQKILGMIFLAVLLISLIPAILIFFINDIEYLVFFDYFLVFNNYFDFVLFVFDLFFIILSVLNPIFDILNVFDNFSFHAPIINLLNPVLTVIGQIGDFQFVPIFGGTPHELENSNPIFMRILSDAAILTLEISLYSIVYGFILAVFLALILVQKYRLLGLKFLAQIFVDFFRSTPLLVQILIIFWGIPNFIQGLELGLGEFTNIFLVSDLIPNDVKIDFFGFKIENSMFLFNFSVNFDKFLFNPRDAGILALSLNTAAYQSEIIRAGIQSIPTGQTEAARGLGMSNLQTMRYVILPQALRLIIPPLTNEGINVILNSSLISVIAFPELLRRSQEIYSVYFNPFPVLISAAMLYFIMTFTLAKITVNIEKRSRIPGLGVSEDI
jgi:His/Glu/Gln/Arg/opine family amino acid ABC transporter permease subunit